MTMTSAAIAARREYKRQWRAKNPDKVKAANERYWTKKGAELILREQQHREAGQE